MTDHPLRNTPAMDAFWMPFTANRQFKAAPRLLVSAEGMHYTADDGRKVLDGTAGLWCVNAGHGRRGIAAAVERQLATLDFAPTFQMGHPIAFEFAERLAEIAPGGPASASTGCSSPTPARNRSTPPSRSRSPTSGRSGRAPAPG